MKKGKYNKSKLAVRPTIYFGTKIPPSYSATAKQIAAEFSEANRAFVMGVLKEILSSSDFSDDGSVAYQLSSGYGAGIINERKLLRKLETFRLFRNMGEDGIYGIATLRDLDTPLIKEVIASLDALDTGLYSQEEFRKDTQPVSKQKSGSLNEKKPSWQEDFVWMGKKFVFGKYGSTPLFKSKDRLSLFKELTKARGNWVTVRLLKEVTGQGENYIRPTIGQIEKSFSKELSNHVVIPSTVEDDFEPKPDGGEGAYRIKVK